MKLDFSASQRLLFGNLLVSCRVVHLHQIKNCNFPTFSNSSPWFFDVVSDSCMHIFDQGESTTDCLTQMQDWWILQSHMYADMFPGYHRNMRCSSNHTKVCHMFSCWFEAIGWIHWVPRKHCVSTWLFKALPGTSVFCSTRSMLAFRIGAFPTVGLNLLLLGSSKDKRSWGERVKCIEMWYFSLIHLYDLSLWYRPASFHGRGLTNHVFLWFVSVH